MGVAFADFAPEVKKKGFFGTEYESMRECLRRANTWIMVESAKVVNVETVVLPNMRDRDEDGSEDPDLTTSGDFASTWHQFIRVWYEI